MKIEVRLYTGDMTKSEGEMLDISEFATQAAGRGGGMNENVKLWEKKLGLVTDLRFEEGLALDIDGAPTLTIKDYHHQDCCESVYADWEALSYYKDKIARKKFETLEIKAVPDIGFLLCFYENSYSAGVKVFIPCYNEQNGYYGNDLELIIKQGDTETKLDISDLVEDHVY